MSFHAQLLRDLELGNDVNYNYRSYHAASSHSATHYRTETTPLWRTTLHFSAPALLVLAGIVYTLLHAYELTWLSLTDALWNYFVHFTPYKLIVIFDKEAQAASLGASKFLTPVSHAEKSAMMRRMIGLDKPGGIIGSVTQAGRRRLSIIPGLNGLNLRGGGSGDETRPPGLGNWDNSCYQNSVLQGLASLKDFDEYLVGPYSDNDSVDSQKTLSDESPGGPMQMSNSLRNLIHQLNDPLNNGNRLWTPPALKNMSSWQQQDAQEYFSKVLDEIDKEIERAALKKSKAPSPGLSGFSSLSTEPIYKGGRQFQGLVPQLRNPLEGLLAQRVACTICKHTEGLSLIPFNTLTLSLPQSRGWGASYNLSDLLDAYTKLEFIDDVVCYSCTLLAWRTRVAKMIALGKCPPGSEQGAKNHLRKIRRALENSDFEEKTVRGKCHIRSTDLFEATKSRQAVIARPPKSLVIHVNRSMFDERTGDLSKNSAPVNFGPTLDLGPWCLGSASRPSSSSKGLAGPDEEDWTTNPTRSMISRGTPDMTKEIQNYYASKGKDEFAQLPAKKSMLQGPIYALRAVIIHQGHHENGHYITYRKYAVPASKITSKGLPVEEEVDGVELDDLKPLNLKSPESSPSTPDILSSEGKEKEEEEMVEEWFRISDDDVYPVSSSEVFARGSGVFMLFYDQIEGARRVDAVASPPITEEMATPEVVEELQAEGLKVKAWTESDPAKEEEQEEADETEVDEDVSEEDMKKWLEELDILSADGALDRDMNDFSSPDTAIYAPVRGRSAAPSPEPPVDAETEIEVEHVEVAAPPTMPARTQEVKPEDIEPSESEFTSTTSTTMSSPMMTADEPMEPVVPIVVKPYVPKAGKDSEMTERGGGRGRKASTGSMLMV